MALAYAGGLITPAGEFGRTVLRAREAVGLGPAAERWTAAKAKALTGMPPRVRALVRPDSTLVRWAQGADIRVYTAPRPDLDGWQDDLPTRLARALDTWQRTGIPVTLEMVHDTAGANVRVLWTERLTGEEVGSTRVLFDELKGIRSGTITIAFRGSDGALLDRQKVDATLLHEVGHLLGLVHTQDSTSCMNPRSRLTTPSPEDEETVLILYKLPYGHLPGAGPD